MLSLNISRQYLQYFLIFPWQEGLTLHLNCLPLKMILLKLFSPRCAFLSKNIDSVLYLCENLCCGYSLEALQWGTFNEYPQHMFSYRNKYICVATPGDMRHIIIYGYPSYLQSCDIPFSEKYEKNITNLLTSILFSHQHAKGEIGSMIGNNDFHCRTTVRVHLFYLYCCQNMHF